MIDATYARETGVQRRPFGGTGFEVSVVGFGGAPIGFLKTEQEKVTTILHQLLDEGVNVIDTAAAYSGSEEAIGNAVAGRRDEFVLISKCGAPGQPDSPAWKPEALRESVDRSLSRLQTDHIDVMLLHTCGLDLLRRGEALQSLIEARDAGKIVHAGYAGDNEAAAFAASLDDVAVIEISINICDQANLTTVLPEARRRNVGVIAKRPIANAAWKDRSQQPGFYESYSRTYSRRLEMMGVSPQVLGFEGDPRQVWPEIALRFTLAQNGVHTAIIGTTNPEHARANLAAAAGGPLPADVVEKLRSAFHAAEAASGEPWIGQT